MIGDLRYALRSLLASRGFTFAAVATLAFGIGINTAAFSVVNAMLVKQLPVPQPDELVMFYWLRMPEPTVASYSGYGRPGPNGSGLRTSFSYLTFERFRDRSSTLANVFAFSSVNDVSVTADGYTEGASADLVSGSYFDTLRLLAMRGRTLTTADDNVGADPVAVISHRYWQRRFHEDAAIVGHTIEVNRVPVVIVGVAPSGFDGLRVGESTDVLLPISLAPRIEGRAPRPVSQWWVQVMARLKPSVDRAQAMADVDRLFVESMQESWAARPPSTTSKGTSVPQLGMMDGSRGIEAPRRDAMPILAAVFGIAGIVLLIGCVNVANLVFVRTWSRQQDIAIRLAIGATRWRVTRQILTESVLLAGAGGIAGTLLASWATALLGRYPGVGTPIVEPSMDLRVLGFAGGLALLTAILCGVGPALRVSRSSLSQAINAGRWRRRGILRRAFVVAQVALSLGVLVVAGQFLQTLQNLSRVDVGFETANLLVFRINPVVRDGSDARAFELLDEVRSAVETIPGVRSTTMSVVPILAHTEKNAVIASAPNAEPHSPYVQGVGPRFFETLGLPLLAGRAFSSGDRSGAPRVAVVNEAMAKQVFDDVRPIGREFQFVEGPEKGTHVEVIGVVRDAAYARLEEANPPTFYMSYRQMSPGVMTFAVKTAIDPLSIVPAVQAEIRRVDPKLSMSNLRSQEQQIRETIALPSAFAIVTSTLGLVALALASIGLYGIVSFDVSRRTREIGIRMALGARRGDVIRFVLREMTGVVAIGAGLGWALAVMASALARNALFGVAPANPIAIVGATLVLASAAALAGYLPARRATRIDPTQALRHE